MVQTATLLPFLVAIFSSSKKTANLIYQMVSFWKVLIKSLAITVQLEEAISASPVARSPEASTAVAVSGGITLALPARWVALATREPTAPQMARSPILVATRLACANLNKIFLLLCFFVY
jgi:hypothetical protein